MHNCSLETRQGKDSLVWRAAQQALTRKSLARARHECVNRRFKKWKILGNVFRHALTKHCRVFHAVANIEQFLIELCPMWQVDYYDRVDNEFDFDY